MELVWDWRLARVYDAEYNIVDELVWEGQRSITSTITRLKTLKSGMMTIEAKVLLERFPLANKNLSTSSVDWPALDINEIELLQKSSSVLAEYEIIDSVSTPDFRLEHLVRVMEEFRNVVNSLDSHLADWIGILVPKFDVDQYRNLLANSISDSSEWDLFVSKFGDLQRAEIQSSEWKSIQDLAKQIILAKSSLSTIEGSVQELANMHLPSLSTLVGPSIAAQLCVAAHGRERLARLPASTIQVLGAEKSFFSHLEKGTKPPKHGYIFQHTWISRSPKSVRGSIARMLAAKAAIAVRIDCYGGEPWGDKERSRIEKKVGEIRTRKKGR